jgi:hypothetical protein
MATPFPFGSGNVLTAAQMNAITTLPINDQTASYVAVVGDVGKRIVMNVATANTVTINNSIFGVGDTIFIACKGAGATTITAGAGVTINTSSSLVLAQHGGGTLVALSASVFTFFSGGGATYGTATGGTSSSITVSGINYTLLTFTTSSTLTVTKSGLFDIALVGAGGSGGLRTTSDTGAGGGGAGGLLVATIYLTANQTVTVGAKGIAVTSSGFGNLGTGSTLGSTYGVYAAVGGGAGQANDTAGSPNISLVGGSGGGGFAGTGGNAIAGGQGNNGGTGGYVTNHAGGGGGGFSAAGGNNSGNVAGAGGAGIDLTIFTGTSAFHCGGGGGSSRISTGGAGGSSVGGAGSSGVSAGSAASPANRGSGGGGGQATSSGAGSDGVVYVRFKV